MRPREPQILVQLCAIVERLSSIIEGPVSVAALAKTTMLIIAHSTHLIPAKWVQPMAEVAESVGKGRTTNMFGKSAGSVLDLFFTCIA